VAQLSTLGSIAMRTYLPVFLITLLLAWAFLGWLGDYNGYVGDWIKIHATTTDRVGFSFVFALFFATAETGILWLWNKLRG
jgi:hypothetical protein